MHELSVAQALVAQIEQIAQARNARSVHAVRLRIGPLSGVVPDLLASAFPLAAAGSCAEQARLEWIESPIRVRCPLCGAETEASLPSLQCNACGHSQTQPLSGDELLLESVDLALPESSSTPHVMEA